MSTSIASISPESAPRDKAGLIKLGIFQLRLLIEKLGGLKEPSEKLAFSKMSVDDKIALCEMLLTAFDKARGVNGAVANGIAPGVAAMPAPVGGMPPPVQQQQPATQVDPAALAHAQQATQSQAMANQPAAAQRNPRTKADAAPASDLGAEVLAVLNRIAEQNDVTQNALASAFKDINAQLADLQKGATRLAALEQTYSAVYNVFQGVDTKLNALDNSSKLFVALILPLAEQVLGASRVDVLQAALGDTDTVTEILAQVSNPGKG